jgi:hypothetical protein
LNNLREGIFLYEVYAFASLYYSNTSLIANITSDSAVLGLKVDLATNRTYPGPTMNYQSTVSQGNNYLMNMTLFTQAQFSTTIRQSAYAIYLAT